MSPQNANPGSADPDRGQEGTRSMPAPVGSQPAEVSHIPKVGTRHIPAAVKRAVWLRDGGRCAFVARSGRRCDARAAIELHHVDPYAVGGPATVDNIQLRCRPHNGYEADLFYGQREPTSALLPAIARERESATRKKEAMPNATASSGKARSPHEPLKRSSETDATF